ncbi:MFS transporter [Nocardia panacis]|uniref:MFS transporter n=1 Tax=Nocardia panacis TaxID=2340916 RepID=UPI003F6EF425
MLRNRTYRRLFGAQVVALVGTGLLTVALGLLAFGLAGRDAGAVLGTALAIKMVAYVAVAPVVSALAERAPRRVVLVGADAIRAGVAVVLPFVGQVWQVYVLIFALQAASATFTPAFQAVIPAIVADETEYTAALSLSRLAYDMESLVSPVLAAGLLAVMSYHLLFVGTAMGFLASAGLVITTALPAVRVQRSVPLPQRITRGARFMFERPVLRGLLAMNLGVAAATALVLVNTVVYVRDMLGGSPTDVALALGCFGGGSMIAALAIPRLVTFIADRTLMLTGAALLPLGLLAAAGPAGSNWGALTATWILLGAGTSMINTLSARLLNAQSDPQIRPAVFAAQFSLSHACFLLTYPIAGWVGAASGQLAAAITLAVLATLAAATAAKAWPATTPSQRGAVPAQRR